MSEAEMQKLADSLSKAFGAEASVSDGLLSLTIGKKSAWINSNGQLEGEANHSTVVDVMTYA
jgi:hypothetical protein